MSNTEANRVSLEARLNMRHQKQDMRSWQLYTLYTKSSMHVWTCITQYQTRGGDQGVDRAHAALGDPDGGAGQGV